MVMFLKLKIIKVKILMKFYIGSSKIVGSNNNFNFVWSAVCKDGILVENGNKELPMAGSAGRK